MIRARESKSAPVGVVSKVLRILEALHGSSTGLQLKQVAQQAALNKSTAYRFLAHLENEGYIFRDDGGAYSIGLKLVRLGSGATFQATLRKICRPMLEKLWKATNETVNLAVLDGREILYLDVMESPHSFRLVSQVGMRRPLYCTALGKAMVAFLPADEQKKLLSSLKLNRFTPHTLTTSTRLKQDLAKTRERGYGKDDEEAVLGSRCFGAPIFDESGKVIAAISVSGPSTRITQDKTNAFAAAVRKAARTISGQLGYSEQSREAPGK